MVLLVLFFFGGLFWSCWVGLGCCSMFYFFGIELVRCVRLGINKELS